ncbi:hypothetical protein [Serratia oryzae]|uniref:Uncharacterized protein n=1 Tax=Serratia oryzae TaxID=2034155 RepID=A0A1S8CIH5_9GAMM|nr:hypothetical protein [Serratia oryzae]OMQ22178.1 hypothetical protein BMI79_11695 [Serratia oryzae]
MAAETVVADAASTLDTAITVIGFIATIASLILAIGAIWLSFVFYKMSNEASKETTKAAKDIQASVERLEKIFDKLYSDTFSMMRDTVTDMRQHIWKKPHTGSPDDIISNEEKIDKLKDSISKEIICIVDEKLKSNGDNETKIKELEDKIKKALESGIQKTIRSQAIPTTLMRRRALNLIKRHGRIRVVNLIKTMNDIFPEGYSFSDENFMGALFDLRENGLITWDGPSGRISSDDIILYIRDDEKNKETSE